MNVDRRIHAASRRASRRSDHPGAPGERAEPTHDQRLLSRFQPFRRKEWAAFRANIEMPLSDADIQALGGLNEPVSPEEVRDVYLPLSHLLNLRMAAAKQLNHIIQGDFLGLPTAPRPYVIGVAGSVAVGKSTFSRLLQAVLSGGPGHPKVALVATDGFLHPTKLLHERGLMRRKGFPESYDLRRMLSFLVKLKAGEPDLRVPIYSHHTYDILPSEFQRVDRPDVVIFEGLNVLQAISSPVVASDYFDFSVYLDAEFTSIERWYIERFLLLQRTAFQDPKSYFHHFKDLTEAGAREVAGSIWRDINLPNLLTNIEPTRERANLVLRKSVSHAIDEIWLRRI